MSRIGVLSILLCVCGVYGRCPVLPPDQVGICVQPCNPAASNCAEGLECCSNGCGNTCQPGVKEDGPPKCKWGYDPVRNMTSGQELFCGRGLGRVDCPTGSECVIHPTDRFAVCCPDPCKNKVCASKEVCIMKSVQCFTAPCPALATCTPKSDICNIQHNVGNCASKFRRYYYDYNTGMCKEYIYSGCGASANHFKSMMDCEKVCRGYDEKCSVGQPLHDAAYGKYRAECGSGASDRVCQADYHCTQASGTCCSTCAMGRDEGTLCSAASFTTPSPRYYFNIATGTCEVFTYAGCGGNKNNFLMESNCMSSCRGFCITQCRFNRDPEIRNMCNCPDPCENLKCRRGQVCMLTYGTSLTTTPNQLPTGQCVELCTLPPDPGTCSNKNEPRFYYDAISKSCKQFSYSGCKGNMNNFLTKADCEGVCATRVCFNNQPALQANNEIIVCKDNTLCPANHICHSFRPNAAGVCCACPLLTTCSLTCPKAKDQNGCPVCQCSAEDPCKGHDCGTEGVCILIPVLTCTNEPCPPIARCITKTEVCAQSIVKGPCTEYENRYAYNSITKKCEEFQYGGCDGNYNQFMQEIHCKVKCIAGLVIPTSIPPVNQVCTMPMEAGPCTGYIDMWYYNSMEGKCKIFRYGGCQGNDNRFATEATCKARCMSAPTVTPPRPVSVCDSPRQIGSCSVPTPGVGKYYYNALYQQCVGFLYSGCGGNANNFNTERECERRCSGVNVTSSSIAIVTLLFIIAMWFRQ